MLFRVLIFSLLAFTAEAAIRLDIAPSFDDSYNSQYRNGDKPIPGCTSITTDGFTEGAVGDGGGEGCKAGTGEYDLSVFGSNNTTDAYIAYKDAGDNDVQIQCLITDTFAGSTENFASGGCGIRSSTAQSASLAQCQSLQNGSTAIQCRHGTNGTYTTVNGAPGQSRPRCVILTFDDSTNDVKGFASPDCSTDIVEIFTTTFDFTDPQAYITAQSRSVVSTTQLTIDDVVIGSTITAYTPDEEPPVGTPPVLVSPIPNQSGQQGVAFSLDFRPFFTGATSHTVTGLTGNVSETSDGVISGTPNATAVANSPQNVSLCGVNADGSTCDTAQFFFSQPSGGGDVHISADVGDTTKTLIDCDTFDGGVEPGDVIELASGSRGAVELRDCHGQPNAYITVRKSSSATRLTITGSGGGADAFLCRNCTYVHVNGLLNWTGHSSGCGVDETLSGTPLTDCGILVDGTNQHLVKMRGEARFLIWEGIEGDGNWTGTGNNGADVGVSPNDQAYCNPIETEWREGLVIRRNYIHDVNNEIMYFGPNINHINGCPNGQDVPRLRNNEIAYNFGARGGYDIIEVKSCNDDTQPCLIHHNRVEEAGGLITDASGANSIGISCFEGSCDIYYNVVDRTSAPPGGAPGIACAANNAPASYGPMMCEVYGNVVHDTDGDGIAMNQGANADAERTFRIYSNTIARGAKNCIRLDPQVEGGGFIRDNICADSGLVSLGGAPGATQLNNRVGTVAQQNFENAAADDFRLKTNSPAKNQAQQCPSVDLLGVTRPQGGQCDQGALEFDE